MRKKILLMCVLITICPEIIFALDSLNIRCIGSWPYTFSRRVVSVGNICYLSVGGGLWIFDISNPITPIKISEFPLPTIVSDIIRKNQYLYLSHWGGGLSIIDISNPTSPTRLSYYNLKIDLFQGSFAVAVDSNFAYLVCADSLHILDITNPCQPIQISSTPITSDDGWNVFIYQSRAYVCQFYRGFTIYDISNPHSPVLLGEYLTTNYPGVFDIWV
ncbi:MAG: hypothetical protein ABIK19_01860, partial [candidate division WOR-3 bacterium]